MVSFFCWPHRVMLWAKEENCALARSALRGRRGICGHHFKGILVLKVVTPDSASGDVGQWLNAPLIRECTKWPHLWIFYVQMEGFEIQTKNLFFIGRGSIKQFATLFYGCQELHSKVSFPPLKKKETHNLTAVWHVIRSVESEMSLKSWFHINNKTVT